VAGASGEVLSELIGVAGEEQLVAMARTKRRLTANARSRMPRGFIVVSFAQLAGRMLQADVTSSSALLSSIDVRC
jgi:hypothetical protein